MSTLVALIDWWEHESVEILVNTVRITWRVNDTMGGNWQGGADESWAIVGVVVTVDTETTAVESGSWAGTKARFRR